MVGGLVTKPCLTLVTPMDCSLLGSAVMGFSRQEYWSGLPFPSSGDLPDPEIKPKSPALQAEPPRAPNQSCLFRLPKPGSFLRNNVIHVLSLLLIGLREVSLSLCLFWIPRGLYEFGDTT